MEEREREREEEEMEQEKKEGETNVCLSDDVDVVDMTNSDSSSAWILTESIHARTLMCISLGSDHKRERRIPLLGYSE